jgi:LPXTG-motif cell wall-anchored protein
VAGAPGDVASAAPLQLGDSFSATVDLDSPGSGTLDAFDPSLGTLIQVDYTVATDVLIQVCSENLSTEAGATTGGPASGQLSVTYPAGVVTTSAVNTALPTTNLSASNGSTDCLGGFDAGSRTFPSSVSSSDVAFLSTTDPSSASGSITDAAGLAPFVGPGTVAVTWTSASNADITQPSEWDIWFVAQGELEVTVTYVYTSGSSTTTTVAATTTTAPCIPPPTSTVVGQTLPTSTSLPLCALPRTGAASNTWATVAVVLVLGGGGLVALTGIRLRRRA